METNTFSGWFYNSILPNLTDFIVPLIPWIAFSIIMVLADWRFSAQLWAHSKERKKEDKPKFKDYANRVVNSLMYVILAGCLAESCKSYTFLSNSVDLLATTGLIVWAAVEFTKCFNKYMELEGMGIKINLFKLFKKTKVNEVIDDNNTEENQNSHGG